VLFAGFVVCQWALWMRDTLDVELENGVKLGCIELGFEEEPETIAIKDFRNNQKVTLRMNKIFMHFATVIS
jgi:hypothetical protein